MQASGTITHTHTHTHLLGCFEPVCRRHDQLHALFCVKHKLLPLGGHRLTDRLHNVYAVVIRLYQLLNLLCHLYCHLVSFLHITRTLNDQILTTTCRLMQIR